MKASISEKYKLKKKLGQGAYGEVILAEDENGKKVALKKIVRKNLNPKSL